MERLTARGGQWHRPKEPADRVDDFVAVELEGEAGRALGDLGPEVVRGVRIGTKVRGRKQAQCGPTAGDSQLCSCAACRLLAEHPARCQQLTTPHHAAASAQTSLIIGAARDGQAMARGHIGGACAAAEDCSAAPQHPAPRPTRCAPTTAAPQTSCALPTRQVPGRLRPGQPARPARRPRRTWRSLTHGSRVSAAPPPSPPVHGAQHTRCLRWCAHGITRNCSQVQDYAQLVSRTRV